MVELELVGLSEDGTRVVLADAAGDEFAVPLDDRLRAVVRTARLETSMESAQVESTLRPRDIQARIRAGEAPEVVAEIARVPVERVMSYAVPVMAERQHIAERAQRSAVRRKHSEGPGQVLWDAVAERLGAERVDPQSCQWDAWRREDGRWTVTARYRDDDGEHTGTFVFDALSRYTVADDDGGRWLVGERTEQREQEPRRRSSGRRLSAVASEYDAMLFDDEEPTTELTAVADVLDGRAAEQPPESATGGRRREPAATPRLRREDDVHEDEPGAEDAGADDPGDVDEQQPAARTASGEEPQSEQQRSRQQPKPEKRGRRGRGRASVPSWDEIMFGQPKG